MLVTDPSNIRYLTGLDASEAALIMKQRTATLFVDGRYTEAARVAKSVGLHIADRARFPLVLKALRRCGYEEEHLSVARLRRLKAACKNTKFIQTSGFVEGLRRKKDSSEVQCVKRALAITNEVLELVPSMLCAGMTEQQLAGDIFRAMLERGAEGFAFDPIVAFGKNTSRPHHRTGATKLRARDIVQIDCGATFRGYCSDRSEVYFVGEPTREQRRIYDAVREAKIVAEKMVKRGVTCAALDEAARAVLKRHGYEKNFTHALGHGVGLDIHEAPAISARSDEKLQSGDVIAIEPGVYLQGKFGIRLEDTVFIR